LTKRGLQQEGRDDLHDEGEQGADGASQPEERRDNRCDQVDDECDREQVLGVCLVHLPRFVENA